ncbi:copper amine oxidase N-terminal domain-containing protein [Peptoniphilus sp. SGI.035]|uniref:copper amine oxidase N-terminal domain-containing protein n=1 Tax=Peptoniphilus sp. SGI.035 TaxID=3420564 RepID=UPI003CFC9917
MKKKFLTILLVLVAAITLGACSANTTSYLDAAEKVGNWKGAKVSGKFDYNIEVKNPESKETIKINFPVTMTGEQIGKDKAHVLMNMDFSKFKEVVAKQAKSEEDLTGLNKDFPNNIKMDIFVNGNEVIISKDIFAIAGNGLKDIKEDYISFADEANGLSPKATKYFSSEEFKADLLKLMNIAFKDVKQGIDYKVEGNTYTLNATSDQIIDEFIKASDGVMKNWDAVSTNLLTIIDKAGIPVTDEEKKDFKELNKNYKAEDLKKAANEIKETVKGSSISEKSTFGENKYTQEIGVNFNFADSIKVSVKGNVETIKDENVKINFPTSVKKLTLEEYTSLVMPKMDVVTVRVNGEDITFEDADALPKIINDRTMLAARTFYEKIGAKVDWNGKDKTVTVTKDNDKVILTVGANKALVNGKEVKLDSPATIINDKTYIPVRFVSEAFGYKVKYDANEGMPIVDIFNITEKELADKLAKVEKEEVAENKDTKEVKAEKKENKEVKDEKIVEKTEKTAEKAAKVLFSVIK